MRSNASNLLSLLIQTWDEALAITAKAWAKRCIFDHNIYLKDAPRVHPTYSSVGENIWTAYPPSEFNTARAIKSWVDEVNNYSYQENSCNHVCGHYTQVCELFTARILWKKKKKVNHDFYIFLHVTLFNLSGLCRLCGPAPTKLDVLYSCAQMASSTSMIKKVSSLYATMPQRKLKTCINNTVKLEMNTFVSTG